jgi:N-sulfoglucosamine sulfohydrolase
LNRMSKCFLPLVASFLFLYGCTSVDTSDRTRPNILWITSEDMNAFIGAFGDRHAITPNLDKLAERGVSYHNAFATAPVCSPSRSCLITGVYATSMGTQHLRSEITIPDLVKPFPKYLRQAGYYCSNNGKEDYNFSDTAIWDESSSKAHWRDRKEGQPFFSVFNFETTHQSQVFGSDSAFQAKYGQYLQPGEKHDPGQIQAPPYHFDSPVVRKLWARYYDLVTLMDRQVGEILRELEEEGLTDETIVFYFSDHGTGMPRSKRALYDSGLSVPLIIAAPDPWLDQLDLPPGSERDELVSFVDFAPTMLSITGIPIPVHMQGKAFLGPAKQTQDYVFGHSDRVDEAYEVSRTVRNKQYRYIRNYLPHLPLIQPNFYTDQSEIMQELLRLKDAGTLTPAQQMMWRSTRDPEELYDIENDPFQVLNLAALPQYDSVLSEMRSAHNNWVHETFDSGLIPEPLMHFLVEGNTIYEMIRNGEAFPTDRVLNITDRMLDGDTPGYAVDFLKDPNPVVRFWAAMIYQIRGWEDPGVSSALMKCLGDSVASVRLTAAKALCNHGVCDQALDVILAEIEGGNKLDRLMAARTFEELGALAEPIQDEVKTWMEIHCPQEDWDLYYELYSCWALEEAFKRQTLNDKR